MYSDLISANDEIMTHHLNLGGNLDVLPTGVKGYLQKLKGDRSVTIEEHLESFSKYCPTLVVTIENIIVRMFIQTLKDEALLWFNSLPTNSITC